MYCIWFPLKCPPCNTALVCRFRPLQLRGPKLFQPGSNCRTDSGGRRGKRESILLQCARLREAARDLGAARERDPHLPVAPVAFRRAGPFDTRFEHEIS